MKIEKIISTLDKPNKNRNLGISVQGLALSHFDTETNQWRIFFPKAPSHDFMMIIRKSVDGTVTEEDQYQLTATRKIEITTNGKTGNGTFDAQAISSIPDLSALHGEQIHLIDDRNLYAGFLVLNETMLAAEAEEMPQDFEIWKIVTTPTMIHRRYVDIKTLGITSSSGFSFEPQSKTEIRIEGEPTIELIHDNNINYEVIFDNDCHESRPENCPDSDFKFYYDIIDETKFEAKCRFDLIVIPPDDAGPLERGEQGSVCGQCQVNNLRIPDSFK